MAEEITLEVGGLYAQLHDRFSEDVGEQYNEQLRQQIEEIIHNFNQQVERQTEQAQAADEAQAAQLDADE